MRQIALVLFLSSVALAQSGAAIPADARKAINAGNQAWVDGMKSGNVIAVANAYAEDSLDCGATGECTKGREAVEKHYEERIQKFGRATSASVTSVGSVQQGTFIYEWGHSDALYADGKKLGGSYLTVWARQPDGSWKIFRNMAIPASRAK